MLPDHQKVEIYCDDRLTSDPMPFQFARTQKSPLQAGFFSERE
jgi:hypothetical protein